MTVATLRNELNAQRADIGREMHAATVNFNTIRWNLQQEVSEGRDRISELAVENVDLTEQMNAQFRTRDARGNPLPTGTGDHDGHRNARGHPLPSRTSDDDISVSSRDPNDNESSSASQTTRPAPKRKEAERIVLEKWPTPVKYGKWRMDLFDEIAAASAEPPRSH